MPAGLLPADSLNHIRAAMGIPDSAFPGNALAALTPVEGTFVIYSAGVNQTALDKLNSKDQASTSVFTRVILPLLEEPNLSLIGIAKRTQVGVRDLARTVGHEQTPAYYDQVVGNVTLTQR